MWMACFLTLAQSLIQATSEIEPGKSPPPRQGLDSGSLQL